MVLNIWATIAILIQGGKTKEASLVGLQTREAGSNPVQFRSSRHISLWRHVRSQEADTSHILVLPWTRPRRFLDPNEVVKLPAISNCSKRFAMSYQHVHQGPYGPPEYAPPGGGYISAVPPPPGPFSEGYPTPPPPPGPPSYQGYFSGDYPPPPPQHVHHQPYGYQYGEGCSSMLRGCLAALCCCCVLEECCWW